MFNKVILTNKQKSLIESSDNTIICSSDKKYDLVYIVKEDDKNEDLRYSLRSIDKFCNFRNVWMIGYKPTWVKNVNEIKTIQKSTKYRNSTLNWETACNTKEITDEFVLMNDDFFAIRPIINWKESLNLYNNSIQEQIDKFKTFYPKSNWMRGFEYSVPLLKTLKSNTLYNYELHIPMIVNKNKFLNMMNRNEINEYLKNPKQVLMKRTIYKNLYPDFNNKYPRRIHDVKVPMGSDLKDFYLEENWVSVFDGVVGNKNRFPKMNEFLNGMFPDKCKFEV